MAFFSRCQRRGMLAVPASRPPWTTSILSTPLGEWPQLPLGPSGPPTKAWGPLPCLSCLEPASLCRWSGGSPREGSAVSLDSAGLGAGLLLVAVGWVPSASVEPRKLLQVWSWMLPRQHHGVRCDFGEVRHFLWASVSLSADGRD